MPSDTVPGATEDPYRRLGLRPFINCCSTRTVHGGSLMAPQVVEAMAAGRHPFPQHGRADGRRLRADRASGAGAGCARYLRLRSSPPAGRRR
jgi:hypothetical protein